MELNHHTEGLGLGQHHTELDIALSFAVLDREMGVMVVASMDSFDLDKKDRVMMNSNLEVVACPSPTTDNIEK